MAYEGITPEGNKVNAALMERFKKEMLDSATGSGQVYRTYDEWYRNTISAKAPDKDKK